MEFIRDSKRKVKEGNSSNWIIVETDDELRKTHTAGCCACACIYSENNSDFL